MDTDDNGGADGTGVHALPGTQQWIRTILRYRSEHPALQRVMDVIERLQDRPFRTNAILLGEAGTGKEGLARALHAAMHDGGRDAPFIEASLGGRDAGDALSELCGYGENPGLIERADGGTLYLDEVATLGREVQARLLWAVRGVARRLGGTVDKPVSVVVLASSDHDLEGAVRAGTLRHDLYWRLARLVLHLPPLRERGEDVARTAVWIANRILARAGVHEHVVLETSNAAAPGSLVLSTAAAEALASYDWPGNFRELDAVLERALLLYRSGPRLEAEHIAAALKGPSEAP